jgi:DNA-binding MurR/RpiR family transcriptional regulator
MKPKRSHPFIHKAAFFKRIKENSADLSEKQLRIADHIIRNHNRAAFLTAGRLASEIGVSESTVIRFAVSLGFVGYPEFQTYLQKIIMEELTSTDRLRMSLDTESKDGLFERTFLREADNLAGVWRGLPRDEFNGLVDLISRSRKVYVTSLRASACLAQYLAFQLSRIRENVVEITRGGKEAWDMLQDGTAEDLLLAISFPRYPRETVELVDFAVQLGIRVASITDRMSSPIAKPSCLTLLVPFELVTFVDLYAAPLALMATLVSEVALRDSKRTFAQLERFEAFVKQSDVFYKN